MYCWFCGKQNTDNSKFCYNCGKQLRAAVKENIATESPIISEDVLQETTPEDITATRGINEQVETLLVSTNTPVIEKPKYIPTLTDKEAVASFVLSLIGIAMFWALPIHILALILGIRGKKSQKRKTFARISIGITLFSIAIFIILMIFVITNYELILNSDFFATLYYSMLQ